MKFKTEVGLLHYLVLFLCWFSLNSVKCVGEDTITMVSIQISQDEGGNGKFVHACGGTLITNSVIFTGCSCITREPQGEEKGKVEILSPDQVRVTAGVNEDSKGNARVQTAAAYALSVHDLCDYTYVYNYGMVKLATSFVLENGLELSHVLTLDMSNFDQKIKSMGTNDCWAEIWQAPPEPSGPGSTAPTAPASGIIVTNRRTTMESIEPIDYDTDSGGGSFNDTTETDFEPSDFTEDTSGDDSGDYDEETSEASSGDYDLTTERDQSTSSPTNSTVTKAESHLVSVVNVTSEVTMPNKTTPAVTTKPSGMNHSSNGNVSLTTTTIMPSGNGTGQNGTNSTNIDKPEIAPNATGGANVTNAIPPGVDVGNSSSSLEGNTSMPMGVVSNSSNPGIAKPDVPGKIRRRRLGSKEITTRPYKGYKMAKKKRDAAAQVVSTNLTVLANNSLVGMNDTGFPGNGSEAGGKSGTVNNTVVHGTPNGNVSVTVIPGSNGTSGGNSTVLIHSKEDLNGTVAVNSTAGNNGTKPNTGNGTATVPMANATVTVTGVTQRIVNVSAITEKIDTTLHTEETGEPSGSGDEPYESGSSSYEETTDYEESGSAEIEEGSTTVMNGTLKVENPTTQAMSKSTPAPNTSKMPTTKAAEPPKTGDKPSSVKRVPVSILDWKECHDIICPDPSKKCDSSFDDTKWCLTSLKDGFRVCEGDTGAPVYCKSALMGLLSNVKVACPKTTAKGVAVGLDQAFEYIKSMMGMPDFTKKVPPPETKARKSGASKGHIPNTMHILVCLLKLLVNNSGW